MANRSRDLCVVRVVHSGGRGRALGYLTWCRLREFVAVGWQKKYVVALHLVDLAEGCGWVGVW